MLILSDVWNQIKLLMQKLDLDDSMESDDRIAQVLEKMNRLVFESRNRKGDYDLR